ncbi:MAG: hypothetical protein LBE15_04220 [Burkholderiales bacterium]|jgi:hypothetical protein|nr:hypothetical protein [Burkholderiales bacterium]
MTKSHVLLTPLLASLLLFSLAACNTAPVKETDQKQTVADETKEEMVMRRSKEFWDARIAGDWEKAYSYLSSGSQVVLSKIDFALKSRSVRFRAFEADKVTCEESMCTLQGFLTYDHPKMQGIRSGGKDFWVIEDGTAKYVFPQ